MINKEDIKSWVGSNYDMRLLIEALQDGDYGVLINLIHDCITELSQDEWIDIKERTPSKSGFYLAITRDRIGKHFFGPNLRFACDTLYKQSVTHWKPLPELPNDK